MSYYVEKIYCNLALLVLVTDDEVSKAIKYKFLRSQKTQ